MKRELLKKLKRSIAFFLVIMIVFQLTQGQSMVAASQAFDYTVRLQVKDGSQAITGAIVKANLNGSDSQLTQDGDGGFYKADGVKILSENAIPGNYKVKVQKDGYRNVEKNVQFSLSNNTFEGNVDISSDKLYTLSGYVRANTNSGAGIANVTVSVEGTSDATTTDQNGYYSISLVKGSYTLNFEYNTQNQNEKGKYEKTAKTVTISQNQSLDVTMRQRYAVNINASAANGDLAKSGSIEIRQNNQQVYTGSASKTVYVYYGDKVDIIVEAAKGCRIWSMWGTSFKYESGLEERKAIATINSVSQDINSGVQFSFNYDAKITCLDGIISLDPSWGFMWFGTVAEVSANTIQVKPYDAKSHYCPHVIEGENLVEEVSYGIYRFKQNGQIRVEFDTDNGRPTLSISGNDVVRTDDGKVIPCVYGDGSKAIEIQFLPVDDKSGVKSVTYKINSKPEIDLEGEPYLLTLRPIDIASGLNIISAFASDNANNSSVSQPFGVYINEVPPTIASVSLNSTTPSFMQDNVPYVNSDANMKVEITDDLPDLRTIRYYVTTNGTLSGNDLAGMLPNFTELQAAEVASSNDVYEITIPRDNFVDGVNYVYVTAEDMCGNIQLEKFGSTAIGFDGSAPVIDSWTDVSDFNDVWKKSDESISMNAVIKEGLTSDGLKYYATVTDSKAQDVQPSEDDSDWKPITEIDSDGNFTFRKGFKESEDGSYRIWLWVKDGCGNISIANSEYVFHVDGIVPEVNNVLFDVKENGAASVREFAQKFGNFFRINTVKNVTETVRVTAHIKDDVSVSYDQEKSAIAEAKLYYLLEGEYEEADLFTADVTAHNALPKFTHSEMASTIQDDGTYVFAFNIPENQKIYRMMVAAVDKAGNISYAVPGPKDGKYLSSMVMVDQVPPKADFVIESKYAIPDYEETVKGETRKWYSKEKNVTYKLNASDKDSGLFSTKVDINKDAVVTEYYNSSDSVSAIKNKDYSISVKQGKIADDGHYKIDVSVCDNSGNIDEKSDKVYVDRDVPKITQIKFETGEVDSLSIIPLQYGFFFKKETKVHVTATDFVGKTKNVGSGVRDFTYYTKASDGTKSDLRTIKATLGKDGVYSATITIKAGFKGQLYILATDNVNQSSEFRNPKGTVIESYNEHLKSASSTKIVLPETSYLDEENNPLYNHKPTISYQTSDIKSGVKSAKWSVQSIAMDVPEDIGKINVKSVFKEDLGKFSTSLEGDVVGWRVKSKLELNLIKKLQRDYLVQNEKNHITAVFDMTDNVGHSAPADEKIFSVDTTKPVVKVEYDNNEVYHEKYYNKDRTATITVTDANFSDKDCKFELTGPEVEIRPWSHTPKAGCNGKAHSKECEWKCTVAFTRDGDYTFGFKCTDRAGWEGVYDKVDEFTLDKTDPEISVTYDNNDARNGNYYKEKRTATVRIEEHNFDSKDVEITLTAKDNGRPITAPQVRGWSSSGDTNTATIDYDYDGEFTFDISYVDLANNEANVYAQDSFVVDLTLPKVEITGVEDRSANNGKVLPVIHCEDTNMDSNIQIVLEGANNGTTKYKTSHESTKTTADYALEDLEHVKELDDLYTLTAVARDKAGNEYEEAIMYSVNRFGSVYVLSDETKALVENIYTNATKSLKVREINVDELVEQTVTYSKDSDIVTLEEKKDYTVKEVGDEGSWKTYDYDIPGSNFETEGKYVVTLMSKDRATNSSDNKTKGTNIEFVVDKTPPDMVVSGIEKDARYTDDTRVVTINPEDNIALSRMMVYCNGKEIAKFDATEIDEHNGTVDVTLRGSNDWQKLEVVAYDVAGNQGSSDVIRFLLTKNLFVQWYRNAAAFWGSIAALAVLLALIIFLIARKQKKEEAK